MPAYAIRWVDHAREQRDSLLPEARAMLDEALHDLVRDPRSGIYDKRADQWTASFDRGRGSAEAHAADGSGATGKAAPDLVLSWRRER